VRVAGLILRRARRRRRTGVTGTAVTLITLSALLLLLTGLVAGAAAMGLPLLTAWPDARQPAAPITDAAPIEIYAWSAPDAAGQRTPVLLETLTPTQAWTPPDAIPAPVRAATRAALELYGPASAEAGLLPRLAARRAASPAHLALARQFAAAAGLPDRFAPLLALQAIRRTSETELLAWYLNHADYGQLAVGIGAAAQTYFAKPVGELTPAEAALLAALPFDPTADPFTQPDPARQRQTALLARLATQEGRPPTAVSSPPLPLAPSPFTALVRQELTARLDAAQLRRGGLRVTTTLHLDAQQQADCVAQAHAARLAGAPLPAAGCEALAYLPPLPPGVRAASAPETAVVLLDPHTGALRALAGTAPAAPRPPGTAVLPFVYLTALSRGYSAATLTLDVETTFTTAQGRPYTPRNWDGQFRGPLRLRSALGSGALTPGVQVLSWVGARNVLDTMHSLGLRLPQEADLTLLEEGGGVTLPELAGAYGVLANGGAAVAPFTIAQVVAANGETLYTAEPAAPRELVSPQLAYLLNAMLADNGARCAALGCPNGLELPANRPAAAFAGQTADGRHAWAVGYTPQLAAGVWVGSAEEGALDGARGAAPIWRALLAWALRDAPVEGWERPPGLVETAVCNLSGLLPTPYCPTVSEWFIPGTAPTTPDTLYQEFAINRLTGRLATIYTPPELIERKIYKVYPPTAAAWARARGMEQPPTEYDTLLTLPLASKTPGAGSVTATITHPAPFDALRGEITVRGAAQGSGFAYYRLAYFAGLWPAELRVIVASERAPRADDALGVWDVSELPAGLYTLLLTVVDENGRFAEVSVPVTVLPPRP
jgi:membrane carboxypeptidase/penicillin-binding protein PbpC